MLQADYQERVDPNDKQAQNLLEEMRAHIKKVSCSFIAVDNFGCVSQPCNYNQVCAVGGDAQE